jgi:hypothetical protein
VEIQQLRTSIVAPVCLHLKYVRGAIRRRLSTSADAQAIALRPRGTSHQTLSRSPTTAASLGSPMGTFNLSPHLWRVGSCPS